MRVDCYRATLQTAEAGRVLLSCLAAALPLLCARRSAPDSGTGRDGATPAHGSYRPVRRFHTSHPHMPGGRRAILERSIAGFGRGSRELLTPGIAMRLCGDLVGVVDGFSGSSSGFSGRISKPRHCPTGPRASIRPSGAWRSPCRLVPRFPDPYTDDAAGRPTSGVNEVAYLGSRGRLGLIAFGLNRLDDADDSPRYGTCILVQLA
jgi:hypothetical protein